jgi:predicted nucleotidyltransferase
MIDEKECGLNTFTQIALARVFKKYSKIQKVLLYGSRAKGNFKNGSDIDLVLVGVGLSTHQLLKIENEIEELLLPYKIDLSIYDQIDSKSLLEHIDRVGLEFYAS